MKFHLKQTEYDRFDPQSISGHRCYRSRQIHRLEKRAMVMRTIGLIGGMSWESTAVYYRRLNEQVRTQLGGLNSADILMRSVNFDAIVSLQKQGRWDEASDVLADIARGLETGGAGCILICTNTM